MTDNPDMTDDWMNPPEREAAFVATLQYPRFLIERQRRLDYFPFREWAVWKCCDSREERDAEIANLRERRPAWRLRPRDELHPPIAYL